ncbi:MAG: hypothetical protein ACE5H0_15325, partial [Bacteroidota bacterium]
RSNIALQHRLAILGRPNDMYPYFDVGHSLCLHVEWVKTPIYLSFSLPRPEGRGSLQWQRAEQYQLIKRQEALKASCIKGELGGTGF